MKVLYSPRYGGYGFNDTFRRKWFDHIGVKYKYVQADDSILFSHFVDPNNEDIHLHVTSCRHDKELIAFVEDYKAKGLDPSSRFSDIQIVEIEGNKYIIDEYDGYESVITPEDIDWVEI